MAVDTLFVYCGVYGEAADALEDYELIKELHTKANLIDAYDAAVIERDHKGKVKITKKHETPTRVGRRARGWCRPGHGAGNRPVPGRSDRRRPRARHDGRRCAPRLAGRARGGGHEPR